ncbi:hypothetical protein L9F63_026305, partial [Diploptera punctata]
IIFQVCFMPNLRSWLGQCLRERLKYTENLYMRALRAGGIYMGNISFDVYRVTNMK